jgi:carbamoyltransferase
MLRGSGLFDEVWVPPFPNDSGAAIGTACCEMFLGGGSAALDWNAYSGPPLLPGAVPDGWTARPCDERQLAEILHRENEPVVVLSGRAEIGPRALGNRSILAPATSAAMKDRLNAMKDRAEYRPVAPICLSGRSAGLFSPGGDDPYMLFDHQIRGDWADRVPAVVHLDGTARLQTIDPASDSAAARILTAYADLSGIPVLCNTSANFNGKGFFPDVASAAKWGRAPYIWSEGTLYSSLQASES